MSSDRFKFRVWNLQEKCFDLEAESFFTYEHIEHWIKNGLGIAQQCTGLKDKLGKLIYEGDIVKLEKGTIKHVFWNTVLYTLNDIGSEKGCLTYFNVEIFQNGTQDKLEIIGNIFENPELLNKDEA